jgi:hypothetical protein
LSYLESWVEQGQAPQKLVGWHVDARGAKTFSRPVYPYPLRARYKGSGDPNAASSFVAVAGK